ncbi:hypothetical protein PQX77_006035 [Marasmius sp. AFHP31]|nr:hypothetical protein PQX77_006035 [Marasmius sp. AFHP31]
MSASLDVVVVGAGFGGLYQLHSLRALGFRVHLFESGTDIGGVWHWNRYPGARVDSPVPVYEYSMEDLWKGWNWSEKFPGWEELQAYFQYVEEKLQLKKDVTFNARVVSANWKEDEQRWVVKTANGLTVNPRFLVLALGFSAKLYIPPFPHLDSYQGICHHTAAWPQSGLKTADFVGKKVAVIGTGASGVQVIQEVGPILGEKGHLTVFQRTPNYCVPMRQTRFTKEMQDKMKELYPTIYKRRLQTHDPHIALLLFTGGYAYSVYPRVWKSATPEERLLYLENLWSKGALEIIPSNYNDLLRNQEANDGVYAFWRDKVRSRLRDPHMQEKLAPLVPPHPFGAQVIALEQRYYDVSNQENVELVDLKEFSIERFTTSGIRTIDGVERGITQIDIRGTSHSIKDKWERGVYINLGMSASGFPNLFFMYGPQAPTGFCNGPTCAVSWSLLVFAIIPCLTLKLSPIILVPLMMKEAQGDWITRCLQHMRTHNFTRIETTQQAELEWEKAVLDAYERVPLMRKARNWWNGGNIPGKVVEPLSYVGGVARYLANCKRKEHNGYEGFSFSGSRRWNESSRVSSKM